MILKTGRVYRTGKVNLYISGKRRWKKRLIYSVRKVHASGHLGPEFEKMFKRNEAKPVKGYKVVTYIEMPKQTREEARFNELVSRARTNIKGKTKGYKDKVAQLAICVAEFQHPEEGRAMNLRDFARAVKFKSFNTLYRWVLAYYEKHYTSEKFKVAIPSAADRTIVNMIRTHQDTYKSYYGFNKKLDKLLEQNAKAYLKEFNVRGLTME